MADARAKARNVRDPDYVKPYFINDNFLNEQLPFWNNEHLRLFLNNYKGFYVADNVQFRLAVILCAKCLEGTILVTLDTMFYHRAHAALWIHTEYNVQDRFLWNSSVESREVHVYVRNAEPPLPANTNDLQNRATTRSDTQGMHGGCPFSGPGV